MRKKIIPIIVSLFFMTTTIALGESNVTVLSKDSFMQSNGYTNITVEQAYTFLTTTSNGIQIPIDVRYDNEWAAEHIDTPAPENPRHQCVCAMSDEVLQTFVEEYNGQELILYCKTGGRSLTAVNLLIEHNFTGTIYNMIGGITAWKQAGYPTIPNMPPNTPTITGDAKGKPGEAYQYTMTTTDIDSDDVYYYVNWSDNTTNQLSGPHHSGEDVLLSHTWSEEGTYLVKVKARDIYGSESDYATLEIKMPYRYMRHWPFMESLFEQFPNRFSILRQLFGY